MEGERPFTPPHKTVTQTVNMAFTRGNPLDWIVVKNRRIIGCEIKQITKKKVQVTWYYI